MAATAKRLLALRGQTVTLTKIVPGAYDPATQRPAAPQTTEQLVSGVATQYNVREIDGVLIRADDMRLIISPLKTDGTAVLPPEPTHTYELANGDVWNVVAVNPINPAGTPVAYIVQGRR